MGCDITAFPRVSVFDVVGPVFCARGFAFFCAPVVVAFCASVFCGELVLVDGKWRVEVVLCAGRKR